MTAERKGQATHTVIAENDSAVRIGKADAHRQLVGGFLDGKRRQLVFSAAVFPGQRNDKVDRHKDDNRSEQEPGCAGQKCVLALARVALGDREQQRQRQQNDKMHGAGQTAQRLLAAEYLVQE